jgi:hypothetical protein
MLKISNFEKCRQDSSEALYFYSSSDATSAEVRVQFMAISEGPFSMSINQLESLMS